MAAATTVEEWQGGNEDLLADLVKTLPELEATVSLGDGVSLVAIDGRKVTVGAGDTVSVEPGVEHAFVFRCERANGSTGSVETRLVPRLGADYVATATKQESAACQVAVGRE